MSTQPEEVSTSNNRFETEVGIDRTKIRVLYVEGSSQPLQPVQRGTKYEVRGPYTDLQQALIEDEDIECVVVSTAGGQGRLTRVTDAGGAVTARGFPETVAELAAFDAILLSDVAADTFTDQQLGWIENWIGQRGGGLMMVGGQRSFSAGNWDGTPVAQMLPVDLRPDGDWMPGTQVEVKAAPSAAAHPVWSIVTDAKQNAEIIGAFPSFFAANKWLGVKPHLTTVLATLTLDADSAADQSRTLGSGGSADIASAGQPAIVAGRYGRGRTMAMAMPITSPWANDLLTKWGDGDRRYYGKFWRNTIYWLTESSSIGRRRLVVSADKKFYRPGETIRLTASAFDEAATPTGNYRISAMIEPQSSLSDLESNDSPIRWPEGRPRESGETGPLIAWGEEFELPHRPVGRTSGFCADAAGGRCAAGRVGQPVAADRDDGHGRLHAGRQHVAGSADPSRSFRTAESVPQSRTAGTAGEPFGRTCDPERESTGGRLERRDAVCRDARHPPIAGLEHLVALGVAAGAADRRMALAADGGPRLTTSLPDEEWQ